MKNPTDLLFPLELIYRGLLRFHQGYQLLNGVYEAPIPSIGVGNLRVGGTGKTPLTIFLARKLTRRYRTGVIHSGYKRKSQAYLYVQPYSKIEVGPVGDEPFLIYQRLQRGIYLLVDRNRVRALEFAVRKDIEAVVLDDNLQYLKLKPHVQIIILVPEDLRGRLLPVGKLREPIDSIKRGDIIIMNLKDGAPFDLPHSWNKPLFYMKYKLLGFREIPSGKIVDLHEIKKKPIVVFCGIADPNSFLKSLLNRGLNIVYFKRFLDHTWYRKKHIATLLRLRDKFKAEFILTTEKDLVRLPNVPEGLVVPELGLQIDNEGEFFDLLSKYSGLEFNEGCNR